GNVCNGAETCQNGACSAGTGLNCNDGNRCTADSCNPTTGCHNVVQGDGTSCSDLNVCNGAETCLAGACLAGTPVSCNDSSFCTIDLCNPSSGCFHQSV